MHMPSPVQTTCTNAHMHAHTDAHTDTHAYAHSRNTRDSIQTKACTHRIRRHSRECQCTDRKRTHDEVLRSWGRCVEQCTQVGCATSYLDTRLLSPTDATIAVGHFDSVKNPRRPVQLLNAPLVVACLLFWWNFCSQSETLIVQKTRGDVHRH